MSDPKPGAARQPQRRGHLDGITKMSGSMNFGGTHGSLDVNLTADGGSTTDTSDFWAAGAPAQNTVPTNPEWHQATLVGNTLTCPSLPAGQSSKLYAVKVKYKLLSNGSKVDSFLHGTIQSATVPGNNPGLTLQK